MTETPDRCPLCGGEDTTVYLSSGDAYCKNQDCSLAVKRWPRVAALMAIRDAAVEWSVSWADDRRYEQACENLARLASEEGNDGPHK